MKSPKSTYLKQIGIICILAHCGSFVPAEKAIIPIRDRLCTRIGIADDQEHNISTFLREMKEIAFICRHSGPLSLVLIDELGRATSNEDGVAIAWAVSEYLRSKRVATFFVTHYPQISKLADVYPGICNQHMDARLTEDGSGITYSHTIQNGACKLSSDYGVEIASTCGWPKEIVKTARDIRSELDSVLPDSEAQIVITAKESQRMLIVHKTLLGLVSQLKNLSDIKDQLLLKEGLEKVRLAVVNLKTEILFSLRSTSSKVDFIEN
jgi:DNA mismatch repair protein MSH4